LIHARTILLAPALSAASPLVATATSIVPIALARLSALMLMTAATTATTVSLTRVLRIVLLLL